MIRQLSYRNLSPNLMPEDPRKAHVELDKQVKKLYGMKGNASEAEIVATLFDRYMTLTQKKRTDTNENTGETR